MTVLAKVEHALWQFNEEHQGLQVTFDGKPGAEIIAQLKSNGFRWSPRQKVWYAKDRSYRREFLNQIAEFGGSVGEKLTFAEQIERKKERAERRAENQEARAERLVQQGHAKLKRSSDLASLIPFGQPILVGHHSEKRHRRHLEKVNNLTRQGFADIDEAHEAEDRAEAARSTITSLEDPRMTRRRLDKLAADIRRCRRGKEEYEASLQTGKDKFGYIVSKEKAEAGIKRCSQIIERLEEQVRYWTEVLENAGEKVWTKDDFKKGDRIEGRYGPGTITKLNPKSCWVNYDIAEQRGDIFLNNYLAYKDIVRKIENNDTVQVNG